MAVGYEGGGIGVRCGNGVFGGGIGEEGGKSADVGGSISSASGVQRRLVDELEVP